MGVNENSVEKNRLYNDIWYRMSTFCTNKYYAELLIDRITARSKWIIIGFLTLCFIIALFIELWYSIIPFSIGVIEQLSGIITKHIIPFMRDTKEIENSRTISERAFNDYKMLLDDLHANLIDITVADKRLCLTNERYVENKTAISKSFGKINNKIERLAQEKSNEELRRLYNIKTKK